MGDLSCALVAAQSAPRIAGGDKRLASELARLVNTSSSSSDASSSGGSSDSGDGSNPVHTSNTVPPQVPIVAGELCTGWSSSYHPSLIGLGALPYLL